MSYSCGTPSVDHCYGTAETDFSNSSYEGATGRIYVGHLGCNPCDGFIDDEMWLNDWTASYWVEAGYWLIYNNPNQTYFWADYRPVDGQNNGSINVHVLGTVPPGDYGLSPTFTIKRASASAFNVTISSPNHSWFGYSTNNSMSVGNVTMGSELAGTYGASAPSARFSYRYYWDSAGNYTAIDGNYYFHKSWPPYIYVVSGDPGQDFYTNCC